MRHHFREEGCDLDRDAFKGRRQGPWPQPAPDSPLGMAAEVLHPPIEDVKKWKAKTRLNYIREFLTRFPWALWYGICNYSFKHVSEEQFAEMMTTSSYSKFLRRRTAAELRETIFSARLTFEENVKYVISDFTPMEEITPKNEHLYVGPTISLFARGKEKKDPCTALAIAIGSKETKHGPWRYTVLLPGDATWDLAKYFVIQGAGHMICLSGHPASHFPYDTVNAVTVTALPKDHTLFQLLDPHLDLHLSVDNSVLQGRSSIVSETRGAFYAPFIAERGEIRKLVPSGYRGYKAPAALSRSAEFKQRSNYLPWSYPRSGGEIPSAYGHVLRVYYATIRRFVVKVVNHIHAIGNQKQRWMELHYIQHWADHIANFLPGFPDENEILEEGDATDCFPKLTTAVTTYIWAVAVAHSLEHTTFYRQGPRRTSFRLRQPPPTSPDGKTYKRHQLVHGWDIFKATLAFEMFFKPHVVTKLIDVRYAFEGTKKDDVLIPELKEAAEAFRRDLAETDRKLEDEDKINLDHYIRYDQLSSSIQY